jgi:hypothetical protein
MSMTSQRVAEAAANMEAVLALSDEELAGALTFARAESETWRKAVNAFEGETLRRFSSRNASLINAGEYQVELTSSTEYTWYMDKLEEKFKPLLTPAQWESVCPLEEPKPAPPPRRKPHAQRILALAKKLGEEGAVIEDCYQRSQKNPKVEIRRVSEVFE